MLEARGSSPEARSALSDLCNAYYAPVFAFVRRTAPDEDCALDLTQEFFARLLGRRGIDAVDPQRGRFRSYLLGAVKHFLADAREHDHRLKRGAGKTPVPLEPGTDTSPGLELPDPLAPSPEREFDRKWSLTLLDHAFTALVKEHQSEGTHEQFEVLKAWLTGDAEGISQAEAARQLSMNESAVKVAIHRLRRQFREMIKKEIARTLRDPVHVDEEIKFLVEALR